ncbi:DUF4145 domain-containing protein [Lederbergia citrea]|uniref:DUF4145 domain-containing protein n=1 Tax=Lederbergia citrea TaxID=2833581 RepID=A0A942USH8_9BACI|nr:DUF4145 domain-containing protein [Lederbergia citrea]MBS4224208.1 DUF4145 domain-containing protein [Lederbergia citrea]
MKSTQPYFYKFIESISKELAYLARELEFSIYSSPRTMLTHSRTFVEAILKQVIQEERLDFYPNMTLKDCIDLLDEKGYLIPEIRDALHHVRLIGNKAAHDVRRFRYSESLLSWEAIYIIVKWYVEVYGPVEMVVPEYQDPAYRNETHDMAEIQEKLKILEKLLTETLQGKSEPADEEETETETISTSISEHDLPGFTTIRKITYQDKEIEVPYFLRDAFLLPQRFDKSERFLIKLGAEQQARIMSELPNNIEGLHKHVKRYNEKNDEKFFEELLIYIEEEKVRRKLALERPGELFFFYKAAHIVVTEELSQIPLTTAEFSGSPSLFRQLTEDQIFTVGLLPRELVILAKYENVGIGTVEKLFEQLKAKQGKTMISI